MSKNPGALSYPAPPIARMPGHLPGCYDSCGNYRSCADKCPASASWSAGQRSGAASPSCDCDAPDTYYGPHREWCNVDGKGFDPAEAQRTNEACSVCERPATHSVPRCVEHCIPGHDPELRTEPASPERSAVVAYLRHCQTVQAGAIGRYLGALVTAIELGEHTGEARLPRRESPASYDPRLDVLEAAERICREVADEYCDHGKHSKASAAEECADRVAAFRKTFAPTVSSGPATESER